MTRFALKLSGTTIAALAAQLTVSHGGEAQFFDQAFQSAQGGEPCYARTYDSAHLKEHPKQTVRRIVFNMDKVNVSDIPNTPERFELGFGLMVLKTEEWFTAVAICSAGGDEANCFIEGDGGRFRLTAAGDGALKLETGDYGIALEGAKDFVSISGKDGDDRVFLLKPAPRAECDAATDDMKRPAP